MSGLKEEAKEVAAELENPEFKWGIKRGRGGAKKEVQFYESFTYDGIEYFLYDCVFLFKDDEPYPGIGKLVKIYEQFNKRKAKVLWFLRPVEIQNWLGDHETLENELFLACGDGTGVFNINPLEAISGKCNIVCTSKDGRNPQPSETDIKKADFLFYRTYNVVDHTISDRIIDVIAGVQARFLFNKELQVSADPVKVGTVTEEGIKSLIASKVEDSGSLQSLKSIMPVRAENSMEARLGSDGNGVQAPTESVAVSSEQVEKTGNQNLLASRNFSKSVSSTGKMLKAPTPVNSNDSVLEKKIPSGKKVETTITKPVNILNSSENMLKAPVPENNNDSLSGNKISSGKKAETTIPNPVNMLNSSEKMLKVPTSKESNDSKSGKKIPSGKKAETAMTKSVDVLYSTEKMLKAPTPDRSNDSVLGKKIPSGKKAETAKPVNVLNSTEKMLKAPTLEKSNDSLLGKKISSGKKAESAITKPVNMLINSSEKMLKAPTPGKNNECLPGNKIPSGKKAETAITKPLDVLNSTEKMLKAPTPDKRNDSLPEKKIHSGKKAETAIAKPVDVLNSRIEGTDKDEGRLLKGVLGNDANRHKLKSSTDLVGRPSKKARLDSSAKERYGYSKDDAIASGGKSEDDTKSKLQERPIAKSCERRVTFSKEAKSKATLEQKKKFKPQEEIDKASWFNFTFEDEMRIAHGRGRLVLLENLDPLYNSDQVKAIIYDAFRLTGKSKVLPHTAISNPHSGQAFLILKSKEDADTVIRKLEEGCLLLPGRRPLIASRGEPPKPPCDPSTFRGHLTMSMKYHAQRGEWKTAVSTSHCSQPNTIEYDMAMEWCLLQKQSGSWWKELYRRQWNELKELKRNLKEAPL